VGSIHTSPPSGSGSQEEKENEKKDEKKDEKDRSGRKSILGLTFLGRNSKKSTVVADQTPATVRQSLVQSHSAPRGERHQSESPENSRRESATSSRASSLTTRKRGKVCTRD
jgi:hypothetical protein